jgi:hypothetical protein
VPVVVTGTMLVIVSLSRRGRIARACARMEVNGQALRSVACAETMLKIVDRAGKSLFPVRTPWRPAFAEPCCRVGEAGSEAVTHSNVAVSGFAPLAGTRHASAGAHCAGREPIAVAGDGNYRNKIATQIRARPSETDELNLRCPSGGNESAKRRRYGRPRGA